MITVEFVLCLQSPTSRQSAVIPGYQGHVPLVNVNNVHFGKRKTEQSREVFKPEVIDKRVNNFSTTG